MLFNPLLLILPLFIYLYGTFIKFTLKLLSSSPPLLPRLLSTSSSTFKCGSLSFSSLVTIVLILKILMIKIFFFKTKKREIVVLPTSSDFPCHYWPSTSLATLMALRNKEKRVTQVLKIFRNDDKLTFFSLLVNCGASKNATDS